MTFFGLLNFYFLVNLISQENFGIWTLFLSLTTVFESVRNAFIYNPLIRYLNSSSESESTEIISASFYLNVTTAAVTAVVMIGFSFILSSFWEAPVLAPMFLIYILTTFSFTWFSHYTYLMQAKLSFKGTFYSTLVQRGGLSLFILFYFIQQEEVSLINLAWANAFSYVASAFVALAFAFKVREFAYKVGWATIKSLASYGKWTLGTNVSSIVNRNINDWLLASFLSPSAVAIYNPAVRISNLFEIPLFAVSQIFYPRLVNEVKNKGNAAAREMYEKSVGFIMLFSAAIFLVLFVFAEPIIGFISKGAEESYAASVPVLRVVLIYSLLVPFQRQFGVTLNAIGKANINFYFILLTVGLSIAIKFFMVKYLGIMGAAWGTVISYLMSVVIVQIILNRLLGTKTLNVFYYSWEFLISLPKQFKKNGKDR
jgi:O-antigen/teichoic acid export membrane protein